MTGDRRRERGHGVAAGCVTSVDKASSAEETGTESAAVNSGDGWQCRCGRGRAGGVCGKVSRGCRGRGGRRLHRCGRAGQLREMLLRTMPCPGGFRGCFLRIRLRGGGGEVPPLQTRAHGTPRGGRRFPWTRGRADSRVRMSFADEAAGGGWG